MPANGDSSVAVSTVWAKGQNVKKINISYVADSGDGSLPGCTLNINGFLQQATYIPDAVLTPDVVNFNSTDAEGYNVFGPIDGVGVSNYREVWTDPPFIFGDVDLAPDTNTTNSAEFVVSIIVYT